MKTIVPTEPTWDLWKGNALELLKKVPDNHFHTIVTSIPYWALRDYQIPSSIWGGKEGCRHRFERKKKSFSTVQQHFCLKCGAWRGCYGLEPTIKLYLAHTVLIFRELRRVLRKDGTLWLNIGDCFITKPHGNGSTFDPKWKRARNRSEGNLAGNRTNRPGTVDFALKHKDLIGLPWRVAFALQTDGWHLRSEIIWEKPNGMPESVSDRPTRAHENLFLLSKSRRYFYDREAIKERSTGNSHARGDGMNPRALYVQENLGLGLEENAPKVLRGRTGRNSSFLVNKTPAKTAGLARLPKQNASFAAATSHCIVEFRNKRSIWRIRPEGFQAWMCRDCKTFFPRKINPEKPCPQCGETAWISHFAVYPTALVEPCVLAGTSEHGCCAGCGAPWTRITEKVGPKYGPSKFPTGWTNHPPGEPPIGHGEPYKGRHNNKHAQMHPTSQSARMLENTRLARANGTNSHDNPFNQVVTVGWKHPDCKCPTFDIVPCRVLDPFSGMGTTVMEAIRLGRSAVGIDISQDNIEMSRARIIHDAPLFNQASMKAHA